MVYPIAPELDKITLEVQPIYRFALSSSPLPRIV
jgi:hypothetical protein